MKPEILSDARIAELQSYYSEPSNESIGYEKNIAQAQRDADHEYYQNKIREILGIEYLDIAEWVENGLKDEDYDSDSLLVKQFIKDAILRYIQSLKSKYMSWSAQNVNISL